MEIYRTTESAIAADGSSVSITFQTDSEPLKLIVNGASFDSMLSELATLAGSARVRRSGDTLDAANQQSYAQRFLPEDWCI